MKILAINGSYRPEGTTVKLTNKALEGAAAMGAHTEHIMLLEKNIGYCKNCLMCYRDMTSPIAPCSIDDEVRSILESIRDADGLILSSPVHCGLCSALMFAFIERSTFTLGKPTGTSMGMKGCPEPRLTEKARAVATIVSAAGTTPELRHLCDSVTPLLSWFGAIVANGLPTGNLYAAAHFPGEMKEEDWPRALLLRELIEAQLQEAYTLGEKVACAIRAGGLKPYDPLFFE